MQLSKAVEGVCWEGIQCGSSSTYKCLAGVPEVTSGSCVETSFLEMAGSLLVCASIVCPCDDDVIAQSVHVWGGRMWWVISDGGVYGGRKLLGVGGKYNQT